jgi:predicted dienelactone hydrolase
MVYTRKISRPRQLGRGSFVPNSPLPNWQSVYYSRLCTSILNVPSGEQFDNGAYSFTDPRIKAAISFSPSVPQAGQDLKIAFARVKIPWMMMTGTQDKSPLGNLDNPKLRLEVYKALPEGQKYQLILEGAEHSVFTEYALPGDRQPRNPNHHRVILALSTAFWDAYLKADTQAKAWLEGSGPSSVLEKSDVFEK